MVVDCNRARVQHSTQSSQELTLELELPPSATFFTHSTYSLLHHTFERSRFLRLNTITWSDPILQLQPLARPHVPVGRLRPYLLIRLASSSEVLRILDLFRGLALSRPSILSSLVIARPQHQAPPDDGHLPIALVVVSTLFAANGRNVFGRRP